jgi:hypothetical protein
MDYRSFSNAALLCRLRELAARERSATSEFVACLAEADRREEAIIGEGYPSLFVFCVRDLKLAESTAYQRVKAARLARARPEILGHLADGTINLSNLCLIAPRLEEYPQLLERIFGKTKREVEELVAAFGGPREIPDRIRPLAPSAPSRPEENLLAFISPPAPAVAMPPPSVGDRADARASASSVETVSSGETRAEFRFAAGQRFVRAVERLRALLWHKHPAGRLEDLLFEAVSDFIVRRDPAREPRPAAAAKHARRQRTRRIPAGVRRAVWRRDGGRCAYSGMAGRCPESRGLEIDHITPWALGGPSDSASNLRLLCRAHNQSEAVRVFGRGRESTRVDSGG